MTRAACGYLKILWHLGYLEKTIRGIEMTDKFNWHEDINVIVPQTDAVAVYSNENGDVVIRQNGDNDPTTEQDHVIVVPRVHGMVFIAAIRNELDAESET